MASSKLKALHLMKLLEQYTDPEHRLTAAALSELLLEEGIAAERKSIYRDIATLQSYGFEIKKSNTGYYLDKRPLETSDARALIFSVQTASFLTKSKSDALIKKLCGLLSKSQAETVMKQCNMGGIKSADEETCAAIDAVNRAIAARKQITFSYYKRDINRQGAIQRRSEHVTVSPYAILWLGDGYHMVCNINGRNDLAHFELDRMRNVNPVEAAFRHFKEVSDYTAAFDATDYAAKHANTFGGDPETITIRCTRSIANEILERFGEDIPVKRDGEAHFTATLRAAASGAFLAWAAQFGSQLEIKTPFYLRSAMKKRLEDACALYN